MKVYETSKIRNIALAGHGDVGKTTMTAAMLYNAGVTNRLTKVDDGNTLTDYDPEEIKRKITLNTGICTLEHNKEKINLFDTPGYGTFFPEAMGSFRAADYITHIVCGVSGVEVQNEKAWKLADELNKPGFVIVNKLDRENSDFEKTVEDIQNKLGREAVPVAYPIGKEKDFKGIVDVITEKAYIFDGTNAKPKTEDIPEDMKDAIASAKESLSEMIAESDEALMDKYFEEGELSAEEMTEGMKKAIAGRTLFPVIPCSAFTNIGTSYIMDFIIKNLDGPEGIKETAVSGEETSEISVSADGKTTLFAFKTINDPTGKSNVFKVISGKLTSGMTLVNQRSETQEKAGTMYFLKGKDHEPTDEVYAGDIVAIAKLKDTITNDTLNEKGVDVKIKPVDFPKPSISFALEAKSQGDEEKIGQSLKKIIEEDPLLILERNPRTQQLLLSGQGQLHVEVVLAKMKERYKVDAILHPPQVAYRETIKKKVDVEAKHKKQSGGKGQYGHCKITMAPLPRGEDFAFEDAIFGGSIPKTYIPAVEKGILEARDKGFLAGYPVVDFKVTLNDGSYHDVDSSEMAFKIAGSMAFKKAMEQANATILEPCMMVEITSPEEFMGDIMGDLNSRRGKIQGMEASGDNQVIKAVVPMAEMLTYQTTLRSITGGRGYFSMDFSHYEEVPGNIREKIIADAKHDDDDE